MQQAKLTVFTPTFNRAYCLGALYESLVKQTRQDFVWLVIDDGSSDNTGALVQSWIDEGKIPIRYIFQQNQGMHGGHNTAYRNIATELNICIDSDDFMPMEAVGKILDHWEKHRDDFPNLAGMVALDAYRDGKIIGAKIPQNLKTCKLGELYQKHGVSGDKKVIYRTEIIRKFPEYPIFEGEKFVPLGDLYLMIDEEYDLLPLNEVVCIVEYLPDGSSRNILRQYRLNPRGFAFSRITGMRLGKSIKEKFRNAVHLVSSSVFLNDYKLLLTPKDRFVVLAAVPFGLLLNLYVRYKTQKPR